MKKKLGKKISVFTIVTALVVAMLPILSFAEPTTGWQGDAIGGKGGSYIIGTKNPGEGAYNKDDADKLLKDDIVEDLNVFVDVDGMNLSDLFEISTSIKTSSDAYKTEQVVMVQKTNENEVSAVVSGTTGSIKLTESKIYTFRWHFFTDNDKYIYAKVTVLDGDVEKGSVTSGKLMNADSKLCAMAESGDHLGYVWVFNVKTDNGVHVYENIIPIDTYRKEDWLGDTITGEDDVYVIPKDQEGVSYKNVCKQLSDGIEEQLNVFINPSDMNNGELFEMSIGIKDIKDTYKTEQVVMVQKTNENEVSAVVSGTTGSIKLTESKIYTFRWHFFTDNDKYIYAKVTVLDGDVEKGSVTSGKLMNADSKLCAMAESGDHLGYVWVFDVKTENGVKLYSDVLVATATPEAIEKLVYNGKQQKLIKAGTPTPVDADVYYLVSNTKPALDDTGWKKDIPTGLYAGYYNVWYKVVCSETETLYQDSDILGPISATIDKKDLEASDFIYTAPKDLTYTGKAIEPKVEILPIYGVKGDPVVFFKNAKGESLKEAVDPGKYEVWAKLPQGESANKFSDKPADVKVGEFEIKEAPKTGDDNNMILWVVMALAAVALAGTSIVVFTKKKSE